MNRSDHNPRSVSGHQRSTRSTTAGQHDGAFVRGFTLVEMLISVGLVLLIMTLFAEIFQTAASSLSKQKGLSENDQRARLLSTIIRGDLDKRTFRDVIPFTNNQDTRQLGGLILRRSGYWYYAENNPSDDTDDELQFTARVTNRAQNTDMTPYLGVSVPFSFISPSVASLDTNANQFTVTGDYSAYFPVPASPGQIVGHIWISGSQGTGATSSNDGRYGVYGVNVVGGNTQINVDRQVYSMTTLGTIYLSEFQPELDDGVSGNLVGQSSAAEISYYLRGGNLYRRVLLIRDSDAADAQPRLMTGRPILGNNYTPSGGSFWRDFDYSAFYFRGNDTGGTPALVGNGPRFHNASESLNNDASAPKEVLFSIPTPFPAPLLAQDQFRILSLGIPQLRFGHDPWTGVPRSFIDSGNDGQLGTADDTGFLGRFTMAECSDPNFGYPGWMAKIPNVADPSQDQNPMSMNTSLTWNANGAISEFSTVTPQRRGADILMTNVLGFDVKVWDAAANGGAGLFVDVGDSSITNGSFVPGNVQNFYYSPNNGGGSKFRYDTWHPKAEIVQPGNAANRNSNPPFKSAVNAVQITINYRDISSDQVRQVTIVQSLVDPY